MAFFSRSNFLAPFHNKIHVFTMVLVAIVFFVFRSSGGSIKTTDNTYKNENVQNSNLNFKEQNNKNDDYDSLENSFFFKNSRNKNMELNQKSTKERNNSKSNSSDIDDIYNQLNL